MIWPRIRTVPPRLVVSNKSTGPRYEIFRIGFNLSSKKINFALPYKSYVYFIKTNQLLLFRIIIDDFSDVHTKHKKKL